MRWFWHAVDTGGVLCQLVFYPLFIAGGILMQFTGAPTTVEQVLGPVTGTLWVWTLTTSPLICFAGTRMSKRYVGTAIQLGANVTLTTALMSYSTAITQASWLNKGTFSPWIALGAAIMTALICLRDARRLRGIEQLKQENHR